MCHGCQCGGLDGSVGWFGERRENSGRRDDHLLRDHWSRPASRQPGGWCCVVALGLIPNGEVEPSCAAAPPRRRQGLAWTLGHESAQE